MEQIENKMVLDEYWEHDRTDWEEYYEYLAEESERKWRDIDD